MQTGLKDKNDIKIFILYLMRNIGYPLDFADINDIVVQDGFVNYFDFAECFAELLETGNVREEKTDIGDTYCITEQGAHVADTLESNLISILKERSLKSALRLLSFKRRGADVDCEKETLADGRYRFTCTVRDNGEQMMQASVVVESRAQLEKMERNFKERPETVYRAIFALLAGDVNYLID